MRVGMLASWRSLHIQPCANSTSIMPTSRRLASTSAARAAASSSGKHSAIFASAMRRRAEGMRYDQRAEPTPQPVQHPLRQPPDDHEHGHAQPRRPVTWGEQRAAKRWDGACRASAASLYRAACRLAGLVVYSCVRCKDGSLRYLYTFAMFLATPLLLVRLIARGVRSRPYHRRWPERFGYLRCARFQRQPLGACGIGGRGECRRAADQGVAA